MRAGLFSLPDVTGLPLVGDFLATVRERYPGLEESRVIHEIVRRQITVMVEDVILTGQAALNALKPQSQQDIRAARRTLVTFSAPMREKERAIKAFLFQRMYRAPSVMKVREDAKQVIRDLFEAYFSGKAEMPDDWGQSWHEADASPDEQKRARLVCDFLAGMTDRYAILEHQRLFDATPELR
ncbi:MAG: hypothetical protein KDJ62_14425 [Rhodobiaceae bacterium]|nr:hypothetical protein [Rhodobiaceae bacterium]